MRGALGNGRPYRDRRGGDWAIVGAATTLVVASVMAPLMLVAWLLSALL